MSPVSAGHRRHRLRPVTYPLLKPIQPTHLVDQELRSRSTLDDWLGRMCHFESSVTGMGCSCHQYCIGTTRPHRENNCNSNSFPREHESGSSHVPTPGCA